MGTEKQDSKHTCLVGKTQILGSKEQQGALFSLSAVPTDGVDLVCVTEEIHGSQVMDSTIRSLDVNTPITEVGKGETLEKRGKCGFLLHAREQSNKDDCPGAANEVTFDIGSQHDTEKQSGKEKKKVGRPRKKELRVATKKLLPRPAVMYQDYSQLHTKTSSTSAWVQLDKADSKTIPSLASSPPTGADFTVRVPEEDNSNRDSLNLRKKKGRKADGSSKQPRKKGASPGTSHWQGSAFYHGMPYSFLQQGPYTPSIHSPFPPFCPPILPPKVASGSPFHMPQPISVPHPVPSGNVQLQPSQQYQPLPPPPHLMSYPSLPRPFQGSSTGGPPTYTDLFQQLQHISPFFAEVVPNLCDVCQATAVQLAPPPYQAALFNNWKQSGVSSSNDKESQRKRQKGSVRFSQSDIAAATEIGVMVHAPRDFLSKKVEKDEAVSHLPSLEEHVFYIPADGDEIAHKQKITGGKRKRPVVYMKWQAFEQLGRHAVDLDIHVKDGLRLKSLKRRKVELQDTLREQGQEIKRLKSEIATRDEKIVKLMMGCQCSRHAEQRKQNFPEDQIVKSQQDLVNSHGKSASSSSCGICGGKSTGTSVHEATPAVGAQGRCVCGVHLSSTGSDKVTRQGPGNKGLTQQPAVSKPTYKSSSPKLSRTDKQRKYNTMVKDMLKRQQCVSNGIVVFEACPAAKFEARKALVEPIDVTSPTNGAEVAKGGQPSAKSTSGPLVMSTLGESGEGSARPGLVEANVAISHGNLDRQGSGLPCLSLQLPNGHEHEGSAFPHFAQDVHTGRQRGETSGQAQQALESDKFQRGDGLSGHHFFVERRQPLRHRLRDQLNQANVLQHVEPREQCFDHYLVQELWDKKNGTVTDQNDAVEVHHSPFSQTDISNNEEHHKLLVTAKTELPPGENVSTAYEH